MARPTLRESEAERAVVIDERIEKLMGERRIEDLQERVHPRDYILDAV